MIQHFLYTKNWKYYPMPQNTMLPVLPVALTAVAKKGISAIPALPESAIALPVMAAVSLC